MKPITLESEVGRLLLVTNLTRPVYRYFFLKQRASTRFESLNAVRN
jgi:hypothetical protein